MTEARAGREGWTRGVKNGWREAVSAGDNTVEGSGEWIEWDEFREFRELGDCREPRVADVAPRTVGGAADPRARDSPCSPQDIRLLHELVEDLTKEQDEKAKPRAEQVRPRDIPQKIISNKKRQKKNTL